MADSQIHRTGRFERDYQKADDAMTNMQRLAQIVLDAGTDGISLTPLFERAGLAVRKSGRFMPKLQASGAIFRGGRSHTKHSKYFATKADADAYTVVALGLLADEKEASRLARSVSDLARYHRRAARNRAENPKPPKPAKPVKLIRKAPDATYSTFRPTATIDMSQAKITRHPTPAERFAVTGPIHGGFASLRPGQYAFPPATCAARAA